MLYTLNKTCVEGKEKSLILNINVYFPRIRVSKTLTAINCCIQVIQVKCLVRLVSYENNRLLVLCLFSREFF